MAADRFQIDKLTADCWAHWKMQVRLYLTSRKLWTIVTGDELRPADEDAALEEWQQREDQAVTIIGLSIDKSLSYIVRNCTTSTQYYQALRAHFERAAGANVYHLLGQLFELQMRSGTTVEQHVKNFQDVVDKLASIEQNISDQVKVHALLRSMPSSYTMVRTSLQMRGDQLTLDECVQALLTEEQNHRGGPAATTESALGMTIRGRGRGRGRGFGRGRGGQGNSQSQMRCYNCNRIGHRSFECRRPQAMQERATAASEDDRLLISSEKNSNVNGRWIVDSGASSHMTAERPLLVDYKEFEQPIIVRIGNGRAMSAIGKGRVDLQMLLPKKATYNVQLTDVLHVPGLTTNLLSVRAVNDKGKECLFKDGQCHIYCRGTLIGKAELEGKLYVLRCQKTPKDEKAYPAKEEAATELWHLRLGRAGQQKLHKLHEMGIIHGMKTDISKEICRGCLEGKFAKKPFKVDPEKKPKAELLELVHSDVCGPMSTSTGAGSKYICTFLDDHSKAAKLYFLKKKSDVFAAFQEYRVMAEKQTGKKLKSLRTDGGGEYVSNDFANYMKEHGIIHEKSAPYTPQQNGAAERLNRTVVEMARAMLCHARLERQWWAEAASTAAYILNRIPSSVTGETPIKRWLGKDEQIEHLRVWGCVGYARVPDHQRTKFDPKVEPVRLLGYPLGQRAYKVLLLKSNQVVVRRDVVFDERRFKGNFNDVAYDDNYDWNQEELQEEKTTHLDVELAPQRQQQPLQDQDSEEEEQEPTQESTQEDESTMSPQQPRERLILRIPRRQVQQAVDQQDQEEHEVTPRRSTRQRNTPVRYGYDEHYIAEEWALISYDDEPQTFKDALQRQDAKLWKTAADNEMASHKDIGTWELVDPVPGKRPVGCKWVFRKKRDEAGVVVRYKARLVAKGYAQKAGVDYDEVYAPVIRYETVRLLLAHAARKKMLVHQMDVETAFLHGSLEEEVLMDQPQGYDDGSGRVCRLKKSLYGLKQSPRCWNYALHNHLVNSGYRQASADACVYIGNNSTVIGVYVDDLLLLATTDEEMSKLKKTLAQKFKMKDLGKLHHLLGFKVTVNKNYISLDHSTYIDNMLKKYAMQDAYGVETPADISVVLVSDDTRSKPADQQLYQQLVGSLLFTAVCCRPDIAQAVAVVCRYTANPSEAHLTAAKRILRYLKTTKTLGLTYKFGDEQPIHGYCDADYAGDKDTRKSTTGYAFIWGGAAVCWLSQKQSVVALSTTEAEYVALATTAQQAMWLRQVLTDIGEKPDKPLQLLEDNQAAIQIARNPILHKRTKHIDVRHHYVREVVANGFLHLSYVPSKEQVADILTKPVPRDGFQTLRNKLGLLEEKPERGGVMK